MKYTKYFCESILCYRKKIQAVKLQSNSKAKIITDGIVPEFELSPIFRKYGLAIDIGTTTIAAKLYGKDGNLLNEESRLNPQSKFGADVISRIEASMKGEKTALSNIQVSEVEKLGTQIQQIAGTVQSVSNRAEIAATIVETFMTSLEQTVESIVSSAIASFVTESELKKITEELSTTITQTAEGVRTEFSKTVETIEKDVGGWLESTLKDYNAYIRCYMDAAGKPVSELGSSESGVYSRITSERFSILENGVELFYVHQNQLQVTDLTVLRRLLIADYAIDPAETGTVSIFKVGR